MGFLGVNSEPTKGWVSFCYESLSFKGSVPWSFGVMTHGNLRGGAHPPLCHVETPQEIASLIKGLLTTIVP